MLTLCLANPPAKARPKVATNASTKAMSDSKLAKKQRAIAQAIKRARNLALISPIKKDATSN